MVRSIEESNSKFERLEKLIEDNGGEIVAWDERTDVDVSPKLIVVSNSPDYERSEEMKRFMVPTVNESWIHVCIEEQKLVPMRPYSPDPRNFLRDVIACFSGLSEGDMDVFKAGIRANGGDFSDLVTRYTTHVIAIDLKTPECQLVLQSRQNNPEVKIKLVKPEWLDVCIKLQCKVDDSVYLLDDDTERSAHTQRPSQDLTGTFPLRDSPRLAVQQSVRDSLGTDILGNRRVFLSSDLGLSEAVARTVKYLIETNGGKLETDLSKAQIFLGKWREGEEYLLASKQRIILGNITWLYWVTIHQKFEKPSKLLHYPEVKDGLYTMKSLRICVTNYTGDARAYLQSLIHSIGATYSGKLIENHTTHLITAYEGGQKFEAAKKWGIPVVNHLWLEDSYAYWQRQDEESRLYTYFPPKLSLSTLIGTRHLVHQVLNKFQKPNEIPVERGQHPKRQAKQKAGNWLHDAMIIEGEFQKQLKRGRIEIENGDDEVDSVDDNNDDEDTAESEGESSNRKTVTVSNKSSSTATVKSPSPVTKSNSKASSPNTRQSSRDGLSPATDSSNTVNSTAANGVNRTLNIASTNSVKAATSTKTTSNSASPQAKKIKSTGTDSSNVSTQSQSKSMRIMFSGIDEPPSNKECHKLGLSVVKTTPVNVLIAPRFLKTVKFLQCLASTTHFVKPLWIDACIAENTIVSLEPFELVDEQLSEALRNREKLNGQKLFQGINFRLSPALKSKQQAFKDLLKSHGGSSSSRYAGDDLIVIGNASDEVSFDTFITAIQSMDASKLKQTNK